MGFGKKYELREGIGTPPPLQDPLVSYSFPVSPNQTKRERGKLRRSQKINRICKTKLLNTCVLVCSNAVVSRLQLYTFYVVTSYLKLQQRGGRTTVYPFTHLLISLLHFYFKTAVCISPCTKLSI